jgi:dTDP-4-amino-4,6-dideoxygalactose transaminase
LYDQSLQGAGVETPTPDHSSRHVYHIYAVRSSARDTLQQELNAYGVQTGIHYPIPVHLQPAHSDLGYTAGDFPHSEAAAREVLSLPMYPELSNTQVEYVSAVVHRHVYA